MAGMNTTYQNGGVQTTTTAGGLPALSGGAFGTDDFYRMMGERQARAEYAAREARDRQAAAEVNARREAQRQTTLRGAPESTFVKEMNPFGSVPYLARVEAGTPGAVMGGNYGGGNFSGGGGGGGAGKGGGGGGGERGGIGAPTYDPFKKMNDEEAAAKAARLADTGQATSADAELQRAHFKSLVDSGG